MSEETRQEFEGIAEQYNKHRPTYPKAIMNRLKLAVLATPLNNDAAKSRFVVDVGSGTGISTRLLRRYLGPDVVLIGVEPGNAMRQEAIVATPEEMQIQYIDAQAEALPFQNASIAALVTAQAIQWFDRSAFYKEAERVLSPGGILAVMQNNRDWQTSPFLDAYETFLESNQEHYSRFYRSFDMYEELKTLSIFQVLTPYRVSWQRTLSTEEFIGMSLSSTRMQTVVRNIGEASAVVKLRELIKHYETSNSLTVPYESELFLAHYTGS